MNIKRRSPIFILLTLAVLWAGCTSNTSELNIETPRSSPEDKLTIWWNQSHYPQEDEAIQQLVEDWAAKTDTTAELIIVGQDDILKKIELARQSGDVPDVFFSNQADAGHIPRWAWDGLLLDLSDVVKPQQEIFSPAALQAVTLYNQVEQTRSVYAVPIQQQTIHLHYWRDLLSEAGFTAADIPSEWDAFWDFWQQAQAQLRAQGQTDLYALGLPMSVESIDTYLIFEQILEAHDVELMDENGNLRLDVPQLRQNIVAALRWYTEFYHQGFVPPAASDWTAGDNNTAILNRQTLLAINPTLSIPASQREDPEIYYDQLVTIPFPQEPDGEPMTHLVDVKQVVVFTAASNPELAKEFLTYLVQPQHLSNYLEQSFGRYFPVIPEIRAQDFWNDPADPHIFAGAQQHQGKTRSMPQTRNATYTQVQSETVWPKAIERIVVDGVSPEVAADEAIAQIEKIFQAWEAEESGKL
ncbi:MAG: carbohydrate ABC transporter substrate-binding protein [Spirulina sp. SIO3F2]|nr:carbohydrate ABC transporter substrate-binding protein [Spirulina sp. SIO3F2]